MANKDAYPCHHCMPPKRHLCCWSTCPEYAEARQKEDLRKAAREAERKKDSDYNSVIHPKATKKAR